MNPQPDRCERWHDDAASVQQNQQERIAVLEARIAATDARLKMLECKLEQLLHGDGTDEFEQPRDYAGKPYSWGGTE